MSTIEQEKSLMRTLLYFDVFSYPLMAEEMISYADFAGLKVDEGKLILADLHQRGLISYKDGFYYIGNDESKVYDRIKGNQLALKRTKSARFFSGLIANFPFVRAVFISGSFSKNYLKPDGDIDYFIITKPGKLWLTRALLTFFKKIFLLNSHRNFCLNYFIDTNSLSIPDKNLFTATEIAFLMPMYNYSLYLDFMQANSWYKERYPNIPLRENNFEAKVFTLKRVFEFFLDNELGSRINKFSFKMTLGYWKKKFSHFKKQEFELNLRSKENVSKHHPNAFQIKVLDAYNARIEKYLEPNLVQN